MIAALAAALIVGSPPGFVARPALGARVASVAKKPVDVYCANDEQAWIAASGSNAQAGRDALGYVDHVSGSQIFLSPDVCRPLLAKINGRHLYLLDFGAALEVLAHEASHISGIADEGETECAALAVVPPLARSQFGIKKTSTMKVVVAGAVRRHRRAVEDSLAYAGPCD